MSNQKMPSEQSSVKVKRNDTEIDMCQSSMDFLAPHIQRFLHQKASADSVWIPDHTHEFKNIGSRELVDVVFLGNYLYRFLESGNWPFKNVRFWTLTTSVKETLHEFFSLPKNSIGVIPREEISPTQEVSFPEYFSEKSTLIYAGRLAPTKNLEFLILFYHYLQQKFPEISLELYGPWHDEHHLKYGRRKNVISYKQRIQSLVNELPWNSPPKFMGETASNEWCQQQYSNPLYCSFSTFISEDFAVSVSQALNAGWPCLLSAWGAHHDIPSKSAFKIPFPLIGESSDALPFIKLKAEAAAEYFLNKEEVTPSPNENKVPRAEHPKPLEISEVDNIRRRFFHHSNGTPLIIHKRGLDHFFDTREGLNLANRINAIWSQKKFPKNIFILKDFDHFNQTDKSSEADLKIFSKAFEYDPFLLETGMISSKNLFCKSNVKDILHADHVFFHYFEGTTESMLSSLATFMKKDSILTLIYSTPSRPAHRTHLGIKTLKAFNIDEF